jgi:hypothetical protein
MTEAVNMDIPDWLESFNEQRLAQRNPNIIDENIPASEVG